MNSSSKSPEHSPARPADGPVHPLAAALLVFVDNLWMLADWNAVTWFLTIPLSFLTVGVITAGIQRFLHRDSWGKSLGKGLLLGVLESVVNRTMDMKTASGHGVYSSGLAYAVVRW